MNTAITIGIWILGYFAAMMLLGSYLAFNGTRESEEEGS